MSNTFWNFFTGSKDTSGGSYQQAEIDERVAYSEKVLDDYYDSAQDWRTIAKKNDEYRFNNQLDDEIRKQMEALNQSPAAWNLIHPNVELAKQFLTHRDPQFQASGVEDSDVQLARASTMVLSHIWDYSDGNIQFAADADDFYVRGTGVLFAYVDPDDDAGRGEVKFKAIDPFKVYIDPNSTDPFARDASHIIISDIMTMEQLQQAYGTYKPDIIKQAIPSHDDRRPVIDRHHPENPQVGPVKEGIEQNYYEVIDRYSRIFVNRYHVLEVQSGRELVFTEEQFKQYKLEIAFEVFEGDSRARTVVTDVNQVEQLDQLYEQTGGVFHYIARQVPNINGGYQQVPEIAAGEPGENAIPDSRVELRPTTKGAVINDFAVVSKTRFPRIKRVLSAGRVLVAEQVHEINTYPIIPAFNNHSRNPYPLADVYFVRELQDYYNKIKSDIAAHLANSKSTRILVPRGSDRQEIETAFQATGVATAEYDADLGLPVQVQPVPLSSEIYIEPQRIEKKVQDIFGIYGVSAGDPNEIPRTYNATLLLDDNAQRRMGNKIKMLYGQLNILGSVAIQYAQQIYTKEKLYRILQPNFESLPVELNSNVFFQFRDSVIERFSDWSSAKFDMKIVSGSTLPNNRWARLEYYIKLYQLGLVDDVTVLRNTDIAEIEEVLQRKSQLAQAKNIIAQQEQMIKDLEGDMQTANREILHNQRKVELEKTKAKLKELEVKAEKDLELFSDRLDDSLRERQKESQAGGEAPAVAS